MEPEAIAFLAETVDAAERNCFVLSSWDLDGLESAEQPVTSVDIRIADAGIADIRFAQPVEVLSEETFLFRILFLLRSLGGPCPQEWSVATARHGLFATASTAAGGRCEVTASFRASEHVDSHVQLTLSRPASIVKVDVPPSGERIP